MKILPRGMSGALPVGLFAAAVTWGIAAEAAAQSAPVASAAASPSNPTVVITHARPITPEANDAALRAMRAALPTTVMEAPPNRPGSAASTEMHALGNPPAPSSFPVPPGGMPALPTIGHSPGAPPNGQGPPGLPPHWAPAPPNLEQPAVPPSGGRPAVPPSGGQPN
jgi:hypothetical protein